MILEFRVYVISDPEVSAVLAVNQLFVCKAIISVVEFAVVAALAFIAHFAIL